MSVPHIADAEASFRVVNITPDFCVVNGAVVPFDIHQVLTPEKSDYAHTVVSRGAPTLRVGSVVAGVIGDAGSGVVSGTATGAGNSYIVEGSATVEVEGHRVARHGDLVLMNGGG